MQKHNAQQYARNSEGEPDSAEATRRRNHLAKNRPTTRQHHNTPPRFPGPGAVDVRTLKGGGGIQSAQKMNMQETAMRLKGLASPNPTSKLNASKEALNVVKAVLKDKKLRWKIIWKLLVGSAGIVIAILIALAPLVAFAWLLLSLLLDFQISGKEILLLLALNAAFGLIALSLMLQIFTVVCLVDPTCALSGFVSEVF